MKVHSFYIEEAEKHGVEKAVILYNLRFWLEKNKANGSNEHDGYYWTYNSAKAFSDLFPYFKERKINRLLNQLEEDGQILSGCFNKKGYDRTKWYSMPEFAVNNSNASTVALDDTPLVNSDKWISQNCQMDMSILTDALVNSDRPIPDINTDSKPDSKPDIESDLLFFNDGLRDELKKWLAYKGQKKQKYTPIGQQSFLAKTKRAAETFGEPAVIELIELSIINGWAGVVWEKLKTDPPKERRKTLD